MDFILRFLKFILVSLLAAFYWPITTLYSYAQKHYTAWRKDDYISYIIATPLYYLLTLLNIILSYPVDKFGVDLHPPLDGFR